MTYFLIKHKSLATENDFKSIVTNIQPISLQQ